MKRKGKITVKVLKYAGKGIFISEESVLQEAGKKEQEIEKTVWAA